MKKLPSLNLTTVENDEFEVKQVPIPLDMMALPEDFSDPILDRFRLLEADDDMPEIIPDLTSGYKPKITFH